MTKREKNLIFLMLLLLIGAGGFKLLIEPQMNAKTQLNSQYSQTVSDYTIAKAEVKYIADKQAELETVQEKLAQVEGQIGAYRQDETIDRMFITLAEKHSLTITQFTLSYLPVVQVNTEGESVTLPLTSKHFMLMVEGNATDFAALVQEVQAMDDLAVLGSNFSDYGEEEAIDGVFDLTGQIFMDMSG